MLGTGQSKHNTHIGFTSVRQGDMLIDGNLKVRGDISIDGNIIFNSQVIINPPACLNTDCINSVSGSGILVLDDLNLASSGNNILITDKINTINPATTGLRINNSYTLPVDASTANVGDVLSLVTPHPLGTVAFTPPPTSTTARLIQNFFQMEEPRTTYNLSSFLPLYISGSGSDIINTADIAVGGSVRFRTKGYLYNGTGGGSTVLGQFELFIGINNTAAAFNYYSTNSLFIRDVGMGTDETVGRGWWEVHVTVTKIDASNNCTVAISGLWNAVESVGVNSETFDLQFYDDPSTFTNRLPNTGSSNTLVPLAYWSPLPTPTFKLSLGWKQVSGDARAIATEYTIDYFNPETNVITGSGGGGTSDHLSLSNLNGGPLLDGGHSNMFVISGAKPMIGNINMNNNDILNVSDLRGIGTNNHINMNPANQMDIASGIIAINSSSALISNAGSFQVFRMSNIDKFAIGSTEVVVKNAFLNMDSNNITNAAVIIGSNGDLDFTGTETHLNSNNDLHLEAASNFNTEVRIQGNGQFKVLHGGSDRFSVANNLITANRNITMDNNDIGDVRSITGNSGIGTLDFGFLVPNQLQILNNDILIRDNASGNAIEINSSGILIDGQVGNTTINAIGADVDLSCNNLNLRGASSINHEKITMNNTLTEHPIIVYLPALLSDFPDPVKNLLVKINSSGNIQPIAYGDPDNTGVIGTTHEIITADGLVPVQVGGICSFTPAPGIILNPGTQFERTNTGTPTIFGCIQPSSGVGTCGVALTGGTGAADGSVKILGMWQKNEHF